MMKTLIKSASRWILLLIFIFFCHYFYSTSNFALSHKRWLLSDLGTGDVECADTFPFFNQSFERRGVSWDVRYRMIDVIVIIYDPKTHEMACRYVSKWHLKIIAHLRFKFSI